MLKNEEGIWVSETTALENLAVDYFRRLYSLDDVPEMVHKLPEEGFLRLSRDEQAMLNRQFSPTEIEAAMRAMGFFKAPGPDGFQPVFYQQGWEYCG